MKKITAYIFFATLFVSNIFAQGYQKPPQNVLDVLNSPAIPATSISPNRKQLLLIEPLRYPPISEFAQPMLRLAGLRVNPNTTGQYRPNYAVKLTLKSIKDGKEKSVQLPPNAQVVSPQWSADGERIAFGNVTPNGIELWIADADSGKAKKLKNIQVNTTMNSGFQWMPDQKSLLVYTVPQNRGVAPQYLNLVPEGPSIQETAGRSGAIQTVQDLLKSPNDEKLFDYYCTSQLAVVDKDGKAKNIGQPAIFDQASVSPDGQHLLTSRIQRPYSYLFPFNRFPKEIEIWNLNGTTEYKVASVPLQDRLVIDGVTTGPRIVSWHPIEPATLLWAEALDGGNPKNKVPFRDKLMKISAPFSAQPSEYLKLEQRVAGRSFGEKDGMMLVADYNRDTQMVRTFIGNFNNPNEPLKLIANLNTNDRYNDIGDPVMKTLPSGKSVIRQDGDNIYLEGNGSTPEGDRPFLRKFNWKKGETKELFRSNSNEYETFVGFADEKSDINFFTRKESPAEPPNLYLNQLCPPNVNCITAMSSNPITNFADPTPQLRGIKKQLVKYKRADGVDLSFTLYLPPNYKEGTRLPTVVWAYPLEFTDASTAGQVSGSTNRFTSIGGMSHLFFLLQGYAVLDNTTMPIVGDPETVNETFIQQVVASAQAAIDKAVEMGVTDRDRVGVGGHSYGAFMTANLLAHSDLFRAGIARSGAYNRTLTPFGFQSERRTFWEAKDMYLKVSPFIYADKINEPILMTHGEADNNTGTFPIQSERMFAAIRGNGGTARLVMLPYEAHGYSARESIEHVLYEMITWFDKYVKNAKPRK